MEFESEYDTQKDLRNEYALFGSRAPYYARDKDYIAKNVKTPFDYIVLDHSQIDADLTRESVDHTTFWNVWRLTPAVYRHKEGDRWLTKHEPHKLEKDGIRERTAYALDSMVEVLLARQANRRMMKSITNRSNYIAQLRREETVVYSKADKASEVVGKTPPGLTQIDVDYSTPALNGDGQYWSVFHVQKGGPFLMGFVAEEDLKLD